MNAVVDACRELTRLNKEIDECNKSLEFLKVNYKLESHELFVEKYRLKTKKILLLKG